MGKKTLIIILSSLLFLFVLLGFLISYKFFPRDNKMPAATHQEAIEDKSDILKIAELLSLPPEKVEYIKNINTEQVTINDLELNPEKIEQIQKAGLDLPEHIIARITEVREDFYTGGQSGAVPSQAGDLKIPEETREKIKKEAEQCVSEYSDPPDALKNVKTFWEMDGMEWLRPFVIESQYYLVFYIQCLAAEYNSLEICELFQNNNQAQYEECVYMSEIFNNYLFPVFKGESRLPAEEVCDKIISKNEYFIFGFTKDVCSHYITGIQNKSKPECEMIEAVNLKNSCLSIMDGDVNAGFQFIAKHESQFKEDGAGNSFEGIFQKIFYREENVCYNHFNYQSVNSYCYNLYSQNLPIAN